MEAPIAAVRFLHFAAAFVLFGSIAFRAFVAAEGVRVTIAPRLAKWERNALWLAAVSALVWLLLAIAEAGDGLASAADPAMTGMFMTHTNFGRVWIVRLVILAVLLVCVFGVRGNSDRVKLVLSALAIGTLGWVGHPAKYDGVSGFMHCLNYAVHAVAAALWVGSLPALVLSLSQGGSEVSRDGIAATVSQFSIAGYIAVSLVLATGVIGTWVMLGTWPSWTASPYQFWLGTKLALVALMLAFAAMNRFVLTPRLSRNHETARRGIFYLATGEVILGYTVLALVAYFGLLDPTGGD